MRGAVHIGPYLLRQAISSDRSSTVYVATHGPTHQPVGLEVLQPYAAEDPRESKAFRIGLRRAASLSNPNIQAVYDAGVIDALAEDASGGTLVRDTPWAATEICSGGSLDEIKQPYAWQELKTLLVALLDGLAHMHARGVIHGALCAENVLINGPEDRRSGLKISGFRMGHHVDSMVLQNDYKGLGSVLHTLAPEQLKREWRDVGPPADLYALGCIAWQLACTKRPFRGLRDAGLAQAHIERNLPSLQPEGPIPPGFEAWIDRLTHQKPNKRFQRAADAAWALVRLGDPVLRGPAPDPLTVRSLDNVSANPQEESGRFDVRAIRDKLRDRRGPVSFKVEPQLTQTELTVFQGTLSPDVPPLPSTWQESPTYRNDRPRGMGLGLAHQVRPPMLNRELERTLLWETFRDVVQGRSARLVTLSGRSGIGKTHLATWLVERAHELGAATLLKANHTRNEAPGSSVRRMFTSHLRTSRLERAGVFERVKTFLFRRGVRQIDEVEALTDLLSPTPFTSNERRRSMGIDARHAVVRRFFRLLTLERPLIVWIEDAHWGNDALGLAYSVMENQRHSPMPVLFLLTPREETLAERPIERSLIEEIGKLDGTLTLELGPLKAAYQNDLAHRVLGLADGLASQVVERTSGNPQLAIEVVGDWVQRGVLDETADGFTLAPGEELILPDDLHAVWTRRTDRVLKGLPPESASFLEAAAVLGLEVDEEEWAQVTDHPDGFYFPLYIERGGKPFFPGNARIRAKLADRLMDFRLAEETDTGWAFSHGMIRESLLRWARETDRLKQHHKAAAAMIRVKMETGGRHLAERLGHHLHEAGDLEGALEPLMTGVQERKSSLGIKPALALLDQCESTMRELDLPTKDVRWGQLWVHRARLQYTRGKYTESERWARQAALTGSEQNWGEWGTVVQESIFIRAQIALRRSELTGAEQLLHQLQESVSDQGNPGLYAKAMYGLASVSRARGKLSQALMYFAEARRWFEAADLPVGVADSWKEMADLDLRGGEYDAAAKLYRQAMAVYELEGERHQMGVCLNGLAEIARHKGDTGEAELGYRHALQIFESTGSAQAVIPRLNLALLHLKSGDYGDAQRQGERVLERLLADGRVRMLGAAHCVLMAATAGQGDWTSFDTHVVSAIEAQKKATLSEPDIAWCVHKAAEFALNGGLARRSKKAFRFAWFQYRGLDDTDAMARIEAVIGPVET